MRDIALITGASKGIGFELAKIHASKGGDLVLTARNEEELLKIKTQFEKEYSVKIWVIAKDLSIEGASQSLFDEVKQRQIDVDILINNAGFGDYGFFCNTDWERYRQMLDLNIIALTQLCHLFLSDWKGRKQGKILNVASTAAFQPGPKMAVYFATKAFVLSLSQAIRQEVKKDRISVTALCPGPTATFFMEDSQMKASGMVKGKKLPSAKDVAIYGYRAMLKGKPVAIHGTMNRIIANLSRFLPRSWVVSSVDKIM